jgi:UDP-N-acetylmuramoyl-L-alanyl-D-glutamate--2,6-diaminopimelate ligase
MKLKDIMQSLNYTLIEGNIDIDITNICYDSRAVKPGDVFFCIEGFNMDGHKFAGQAFKNGAIAIVCSKEIEKPYNCTIIKVENGRKALALASACYFGNPSSKLKLIGITGTNGKTTSTFMMKAILEEAGFKVGVIGTIANYIGDTVIHTERTTPESLELNKLFKEMVEAGVTYCLMEVSSHSLSLDRVFGLRFNQSIFTNLTRDHLDFHKTFENYYEAKLKLFKCSANSIINIDDEYGYRVYKDIDTLKTTYSINKKSDFSAKNISMNSRGAEFEVVYEFGKGIIKLEIPGKYNVYNALASIAACINEGMSLVQVKNGLEKVLVPGRCEIVAKKNDLPYTMILDYAHTPDALDNILKTVREFTMGRLISVFGCGGDRDKTKRPLMGDIACQLSDVAIITSDNPRNEEPSSIIKDILEGVKKNNYLVIENRRAAIKKAMELAEKNDVIVIAGKGHEDYQVLKGRTIHFDEREVIAEIIKELY